MTENDYKLINLRYSCPLLRHEDIQAGKVPTAPTISSMIAGLQTQEALKLIHGMPVATGQAMVYNGLVNNFYKTDYQRREDCLSHETYPAAIEVPLSAAKHTATELFTSVHEHLHDHTNARLSLDRDLVVSLDCTMCGHSQEVLRPLQLVGMSEAECPKCGKLSRPVLEHTIEEDSPLAEKKLSQLGIPPYDIVRVTTDQGEQVFLLAGDRE
jgi:adenylyltransferase/sulfurtransferase